MRNERADVVIVGCRPAGVSPAIALAQHTRWFPWQRNPPTDLPKYNPPVAPSELISTDLVDEPVEGTMTAKVGGSDAV
jgi:hypothetical protein